MKSLSKLLFLAALAASAFAQMNQPMVGENPTKISDHVWAIMGFPNIAIVVGSRAKALHFLHATQQTVDFLRETRGLSAADAYALASIAVDFRVAEAVDAVQMVYGAIPKKIFKQNPEYWKR